MSSIRVSVEARRGCGYRTKGGLYLVAPATGMPCCRMPIQLDRCPTCSCGIKPARGWTWVDAAITADAPQRWAGGNCSGCLVNNLTGKCGLLWVGGQYYPTPDDFLQEVRRMGLSRRIPALPKGFELGKTIVLLAHRDCTPYTCPDTLKLQYKPGIFSVFRPTAVEKVVDASCTEEEAAALRKRGIEPVIVQRLETQQELPL